MVGNVCFWSINVLVKLDLVKKEVILISLFMELKPVSMFYAILNFRHDIDCVFNFAFILYTCDIFDFRTI